MYDVLNFSIRSAPTIANKIPNHIGLINTSVGIIVSKNIPKDIPPKVTWLRASAISDSRLTTIKAPIRGAIKPIKIPLIKEYLIKSKFNNASINCDTPFHFK